MGTIRLMSVESSKPIGVYFKCHCCENENFQLQKITARGSAQANGIPWGKEAQAEQTSRLQETAKSAANTNLEILEQKYEKSINQYRRLWGAPLIGECQKCGQKQIWDQLKSIHYGKIPIIIFVVGSIMCLRSHMGTVTIVCLLLLLSLVPVSFIIYQGVHGFQKVKKLQNLDQRYYPIIVTHENLDTFLTWKNSLISEYSGIGQENTKSYNKPIYVILQMLKSICLILGITCLLIGDDVLGYTSQIKVPVEYQQYDYMSEKNQYVYFDAISMVKIGREIFSSSEYEGNKIFKVYFYLEDEKGNQGIASMHSSEASAEFKNSFYSTSDIK